MLVIPFELWQYCTTVFTAVVPRRCVVFRSKLSAARCAAWVSRPPTVGAATAIAWWRCREAFLAYVIMESVCEKEEQEGKTVAIVGVFVLLKREKMEMLFLTSPYFVYLCTKPRSIYLFCQTNYYAFFSSTRFLEFVYTRPVRCCEL